MNKCSYVCENAERVELIHRPIRTESVRLVQQIQQIIKKENPIMKKTYKIEVDCANCANKMEDAAKNTAGVKDATVNFMALKMKVEFEEGADVDAVMHDVLRNCRKVEDDCEIYI